MADTKRTFEWSDETLWTEPLRKQTSQLHKIGQLANRLLFVGFGETKLGFYLSPEPGREVIARFGFPSYHVSTHNPTLNSKLLSGEAALRFHEKPVDLFVALSTNAAEHMRISVNFFNPQRDNFSFGAKVLANPMSDLTNSQLFASASVQVRESILKVTASPTHRTLKLRGSLNLNPFIANVVVSATKDYASLERLAFCYLGQVNRSDMPARYEISLMKNRDQMIFSYVHQMIWYGRRVSMGGQFTVAEQSSTDLFQKSQGLATSMVVGGSWQVSYNTYMKAKVDSNGQVDGLFAIRTAQFHPFINIKFSASTMLSDPFNALKLGLSVGIEQS